MSYKWFWVFHNSKSPSDILLWTIPEAGKFNNFLVHKIIHTLPPWIPLDVKAIKPPGMWLNPAQDSKVMQTILHTLLYEYSSASANFPLGYFFIRCECSHEIFTGWCSFSCSVNVKKHYHGISQTLRYNKEGEHCRGWRLSLNSVLINSNVRQTASFAVLGGVWFVFIFPV